MATRAAVCAKAWWYNPRDGESAVIGEFSSAGQREFVPPSLGENMDWVLVLDDAARGFPAPGKGKAKKTP